MLETKGNTLKTLENKIELFLTPKSVIFNISQWINHKQNIINTIKTKFKKKIIFRSSTTFEDTNKQSAAGAFDSVLNINAKNDQEIIKSINKVIKSYKKKIKKISEQQILVQEMIQNIKMSGVIFTGNNLGYKNYYTINYDDVTGRTDTVTSGNTAYSNKTLYIYKDKKKFLRSPRFKELISATKEVENYFNTPLDIEFCMTKKNQLYLFQVRPIVLKKNSSKRFTEKNINKKLEFEYYKIKKSFKKKNESELNGKTTMFSQMSDWNPAEMIGQFPSKLSYSLYSKLITDKCWLIARKKMGYKFFKDSSLMKIFAGRPYIDIRKSLNSLLPKDLNKDISQELINRSILKLKVHPSSHDKIEFDLFPTCFSFQIKKKLKDLGYKKNHHNIENKLLKIFLINLKNKNHGSIKYNLKKIEILNKKQKENNYDKKFNVLSIKGIIKDLKEYGIIPFSILARHGFVAKDILISLKEIKILSEIDVENFLRSFSTVTTDFLNDQVLLKNKQLSYKDFLNKYGHLRAGTYDIKSNNYSKMSKKILINDDATHIIKHAKFNLSNNKKTKIQKLLNKKMINLNVDQLFKYIEASIKSREYAKFIFTKSINIILEKITSFAKDQKVKTKEIENLTIDQLMNLSKFPKTTIKNKIQKNIKESELNKMIKLPEIIVEDKNAYVGASVVSIPNFVTEKNITGKILFLNNKIDNNLDNKIILLENADPGFDFIFSFNINGLITKYGGANSHMTIRCNELNIPAAIGCGEAIFEKIKRSKKINLNCKNLLIREL
jgi:glutamine kinase